MTDLSQSGQHLQPAEAALAELHRSTIQELLVLLEGLYSNIDDGLFELADREPLAGRRDRCFNLMRELRCHRGALVVNFAGTMQALSRYWFVDESWQPVARDEFLAPRLASLTDKSDAHYSGLLRLIRERSWRGTDIECKTLGDLPIGPAAITHAFVTSCRSVRMDDESIGFVFVLFGRFVLDRLGQVYARGNQLLREAGCVTSEESVAASAIRLT